MKNTKTLKNTFLFAMLQAALIAGCSGSSGGGNNGANGGSEGGTQLPSPDQPTVWTKCADENGVCFFDGMADVRYGLGDTWVVQTADFAKSCTNSSFGVDPVQGQVKICEYGNLVPKTPPDNEGWTFCSNEYEQCNFTGTMEVRYGKHHIFVKGTYTNGVSCNNSTFGDPLVGIVKECQIRPVSP